MCHNVQLEKNSLNIDCRGDMIFQQIFDVNVLKHNSELCTTNQAQADQSPDPDEKANFTNDLSNDKVQCGNDKPFFDKQKLVEDLN